MGIRTRFLVRRVAPVGVIGLGREVSEIEIVDSECAGEGIGSVEHRLGGRTDGFLVIFVQARKFRPRLL